MFFAQLPFNIIYIVGILEIRLTRGFYNLHRMAPLKSKQGLSLCPAKVEKPFAFEGVGNVNIKGGLESIRNTFPLVIRFLFG